MKYKVQYGFEEAYIVEGETIDEIKETASKELDKRGWKKDYQNMPLNENMLEKLDD
jgi:transcriptional regulator